MFDDIEAGILERLQQTDAILEYLKQQTETSSQMFKTQKGMIFVTMYACIEYSLTQSLTRALEIIGQSPEPASAYKSIILCTLLDRYFKGIRDCGKKQIWTKREELLDIIINDDVINDIDSSVFPSEGSMNISATQIENVWKYLNVEMEYLPEGVNRLAINDIKEQRNAIAHGRTSAADVGRRYTMSTLEQRVQDVRNVSLYFTMVLNDYCANRKYLND
ncbi:TPA: HEPN domain-containing protein [Photobacterium damselae]|uniref:HEPN domain-containing protein n=1 Tax=Photobacterium damselae TaxID=38293 RepID=UPI003D7C5B3C